MTSTYPAVFRFLTAVTLLIAATSAAAQTVFRCTDHEGHIAFQQQACPVGSTERRIELAPVPVQAAAVIETRVRTERRKPLTRQRQPRAATAAMSFRCTSASGAVFFRHSSCPKSIPRRAGSGTAGAAGGKADPVSATRIPRRDACRQIGSFGRTGHEHDDSVSTYERNAGRDPCRRH